MKFLKSIHKFIPGFRQLSANSMIIAATYYGAAVLTAVKYPFWGLALLALPFLIFYLLDLNRAGGRRAPLVVSVAAGLLVLLGAAGGLSSGGAPQTPQDAIGGSSISATTATIPSLSSTKPAGLAPALSATAGSMTAPAVLLPSGSPKPGQFPYVAAKGGKVFHLPGCASAQRIKPENLVGFATREEALAAGLQPCQKCKP